MQPTTARRLIALALLAASSPACAQAYPSRPVRIVVPFPPNGSADLLSRTIAAKIAPLWKQQILVDNRPGAGGNIGAEATARAAPDGYTLIMAPVTTYAVGMAAYRKLGWSLARDLAPVSMVANIPHVLVAHPSLPVRNVRELIALGRARPGELNFASQGNGTLSHVEQEMLKQLGAFTAQHVPYKGSAPGLADLIPGYVQLFFDSIPSSGPHIRTGRLRGIGVASSSRSPALPDLPAIAESLPGFEADSWFGLMAPAATPREVVARWNTEVQRVLAAPEIRERLALQGGLVKGGTPEEMDAAVRADIEKWGKVVRTARVVIE